MSFSQSSPGIDRYEPKFPSLDKEGWLRDQENFASHISSRRRGGWFKPPIIGSLNKPRRRFAAPLLSQGGELLLLYSVPHLRNSPLCVVVSLFKRNLRFAFLFGFDAGPEEFLEETFFHEPIHDAVIEHRAEIKLPHLCADLFVRRMIQDIFHGRRQNVRHPFVDIR